MIFTDMGMATPRAAMRIPFYKGQGGMAGMGDYTSPDDSTVKSITDAISSAVTAYNQQEILQANIDRAKMGLPPINTSQIAPTYNVGLAPDTRNALLLAGLAILVVLLLKRS